MNGYRRANTTGGSVFLPPSNVNLPTEVDWRKQGYVTDVKNQKRVLTRLPFLKICNYELLRLHSPFLFYSHRVLIS
ncbi:hypothetical protein CHS0354_042232 [Potamilus streckersoni]|uniref:Uncharacterized protein n=1 Tax=Potamilus streckersoni TaxID=2493646 RepID=A0AAE0SUF2_9BIVA|nr:hypothetical protein CHS0354_042232 [Potamilus streckersoni]